MSYWDTSALVKLYLEEDDSAEYRTLATQADHITTASLTRFEARSVFHRKEAASAIVMGKAAVLTEALLADLETGCMEVKLDSTEIESQFERVLAVCGSEQPPHRIRTLDAIHIAAALVALETRFLSADIRQRNAAKLLGFEVFPSEIG